MFVLHKALNGRHLATEFCRRREERKWNQLAEEEEREGTEAATAITAYRIPLYPIYFFK